MPESCTKVIELQCEDIDHSYQYPYVLSCSDQEILFSLRSKKTYNLNPVLLLDLQKTHDSLLPLKKGHKITDPSLALGCEILQGTFTDDGEWLTTYVPSKPGLVTFQLVFTQY